MSISLSRLHFPVTTLGPGKRVGIWTQGCSIRCPGCLSPDTWRFSRQTTPLVELMTQLTPWLAQADGVTISGGEPFDQPQALLALLAALRNAFDGDILVFSGYSYARLGARLAQAEGLIDALVSEPFEQHSPQTLRLRGSDNQRLHLLSELGRRRFAHCEWEVQQGDKVLDLTIDEHGVVSLIGIPRRGDLERLRELLEQQGHGFRQMTR